MQLLVERLAGHVFGLFIAAAASKDHGVFDGIPIQKFLIGAPASVLWIVAREIIRRELCADGRG